MPNHQSRYPIVNPRLRTLYAIFTSSLIGVVMLLIILERLGVGKLWLSHLMSGIPLACAAFIGFIAMNNIAEDFFVAGRRVPASFNGFALALTSLGGVGLLSLTGAFYLIGFDALALSLGWCLGFVIMALLIAPYLRRVGAYTLPGFFAERFQNKLIGFIAVPLTAVPVFLLLIAELKIGTFAGFLITGQPKEIVVAAIVSLTIISVILGGMRSLTWSQCAHFIVVLIGYLTPLFILAILITNLPLPQITYGTLLGDLTRLELANGLIDTQALPLSQSLTSTGPETISKLFLQSFGAISQTEFFFLLFCFLGGSATFPTLLVRASTSPTVHDARRAVGWGLFLLGILLISAPAYAVFAKYLTMQNLIGATIDQLPSWTKNLISLGILEIKDQDQNASLGLNELFVLRDGVTFILPIMASLPFVLIILTVTAALSAAIGSAAGQLVLIANTISHDFFHSYSSPSANSTTALHTSRIAMVLIVAVAAWFSLTLNLDPFWLLAWAFSLSASTLLAPLILAILWKRFTAHAAIASMTAGFTTSLLYIWMTPTGSQGLIPGIDHLVSAVIGVPVSLITAIVISWLTAKPGKEIETMLDEIRNPEGEPLYDRTLRTSLRQKIPARLPRSKRPARPNRPATP